MFCPPTIILIVDREDEVLELLRTASQSIDYVVLEAKTGEEALGVLSQLKSRIDITIIDLNLCIDGGVFMTLLAIFASRMPTTKVIIKTSRHDTPFLEQVNSVGVNATVLKPITKEQLLKTIQATLSERRRRSAGASAGTAA
jgi:DNA-binding response OmpR family regulator